MNALQHGNDYINCEFIHTVKFYVTDKRQKDKKKGLDQYVYIRKITKALLSQKKQVVNRYLCYDSIFTLINKCTSRNQ